jgi:hypothetical protein
MENHKRTIEITLGGAVDALIGLNKMLTGEFEAKDAHRIARSIALLRAHPEVMATAQTRDKLIQRYSQNGRVTDIDSLNANYSPIAGEKINLEIVTIPIAVLESAPKMTPFEMLSLEQFWEYPKEEEKKESEEQKGVAHGA